VTAHGTYAGYQRHKAYDQEPCHACREANRVYHRAYRYRTGRSQAVMVPVALLRALAATAPAELAAQAQALLPPADEQAAS
jgi:hypothetical protein